MRRKRDNIVSFWEGDRENIDYCECDFHFEKGGKNSWVCSEDVGEVVAGVEVIYCGY